MLTSHIDQSPPQAGTAPPVFGLRTTVLPRIEMVGEVPRLSAQQTARYESVGRLGEGAMGEVARVVDHDIGRLVARKRLRAGAQSPASVARFVEEIRVIGQLEHPNIVPIHDVGVDEEGKYFFMMKLVEGQTLEAIIERLRAGDAETQQRFPLDHRIELFLKLLDAIAFAHSKGIIHRDLKPANIMVGPFGEVVVMDWGVAKKLRGNGPAAPNLDQLPHEAPAEPRASVRPEFFSTRHGTLIGTPAYMSPEQALGATGEIDERSDIYALCVILHEFLTLEHYLGDKRSAIEMLIGVAQEEPTPERLEKLHPTQKTLDMTWLFFAARGLGKAKTQRYQSVAEMLSEAHRIRQGRCLVVCPASFTKRAVGELGRLVDRAPKTMPYVIFGTVCLILFLAVLGVVD
jgi:serine/threonine-protein kinase